jgi:diaminopimelate epimerase
MKFTKMQGIGNDYVYIDCTDGKLPENISDLAIKMSDRHFGIGSDGLVLICKSEVADFKMRMFNSDGSEAQMCGNASRCIGKYVFDKGLTKKTSLSLETLAGIKNLELFVKNNLVEKVCVNMGEPVLEAKKIPVVSENHEVINEKYQLNEPHCVEMRITCVSMGNPHCVIFVDNVADFDVHKIGKIIENDLAIFPEKVNVEFVEVIDRKTVKMRVWERGAGETLACGTGASATTVASVLNNKSDRKITVKLLGGDLEIEWREDSNQVMMTGTATTVFEGEFLG